jgi:DTW domain-containing protein YfiP
MLGAPAQIRLIVLDATWRKSRKILHRNPLLHRLPRLSLQGLPASSYRIRKAHSPEQLSTLEATCAALAQLDGNREKYQPLLAAFDGFVAQQMCLAAQGLLSHRGR